MSAGWETQKKMHAQGKIAMAYLGSWYPQQLQDNGANIDDIGMFPFPGSKALTGGPEGGLVISKTSKNPELAKAFLKYILTENRYVDAVGGISPEKGAKVPGFVQELLSYNLPIVSVASPEAAVQNIYNKGSINLTQIYQEAMLAKNADDVIAKWNKAWVDAKSK